MATDAQLKAAIEELRSQNQYTIGQLDAITRLLAVMARDQKLDMQEGLADLEKLATIYDCETESDKREGYVNTVEVFLNQLLREPGETPSAGH